MFAAQIATNISDTAVESRMRIDPINVPEDTRAYPIADLATAKWDVALHGQARLRELSFLGTDVLKSDRSTLMKLLGVINKITHDFRERRYPASIDHLTEYDLHDWTNSSSPPPRRGRLVLVALGGKNMEEIAEGFGNGVNGNCNVVKIEWIDDEGKIHSIGAPNDVGGFLSELDIQNRTASPYLSPEVLKYQNWFFTHRHLDHIDGAIIYIAKGYCRDKIFHASPKCIRAFREKLATLNIPKENYPTFVPLKKGTHWEHIKDENGVTRLSVGYNLNATPHTGNLQRPSFMSDVTVRKF